MSTSGTPGRPDHPRKPSSSRARKKPTVSVQGIVGVGLDATDGQKRITRTEEMVLLGGSKETHERMQETAIRFSEGLEKAGKKLPEASIKQVLEILHEAIVRTGRA